MSLHLLWTSCRPTACIMGVTGCSCCRHHNSKQHRDTCQISWWHHVHHWRPETWSSSCSHEGFCILCQHSMPCLTLEIHSSVMSIRSSAQRSFHSAPVRNSRESTSSTKIKSSGLRTGPWCTPNFYTKLLPVLAIDPHTTLEYMPCMIRRAHYPTQRLLKADHRTFFGKRPKAFPRLTEAK